MKTRHSCPQCNKPKKYTRYIDEKTGEYLPFQFGKCERLNNCGYHLNPYTTGYAKQVYQQEKGTDSWRELLKPSRTQLTIKTHPQRKTTIPVDVFQGSLRNYQSNTFVQYLDKLFGQQKTRDLIQRFYIGSSSYWKSAGATVFWLVDEHMDIVGGQVILYDQKGHTKKERRQDGSVKRYNSWVHVALKQKYKSSTLPSWLKTYIETEGNKFPCLFGLPQLMIEPDTKPIAIVESAKTAVIATGYLPQYIWMAVGGLSYLNENRLKALHGRNITLFPDKGAFKIWEKRTSLLSSFANLTISNLLEKKNAKEGSDIADYLIDCDPAAFNKEIPFKTTLPKKEIFQNESLPRGWNRNDKKELIDSDGLVVLDWWSEADILAAPNHIQETIRSENN